MVNDYTHAQLDFSVHYSSPGYTARAVQIVERPSQGSPQLPPLTNFTQATFDSSYAAVGSGGLEKIGTFSRFETDIITNNGTLLASTGNLSNSDKFTVTYKACQ